MKYTILMALILASIVSIAQPQFGGQIGGYDNSGSTKRFWMFTPKSEGKVWDSTAHTYLIGIKSLDSSINAKLNSTIAVTQSGAWNIGLNAGSNAIGSITNTSFAISGSLPNWASPPTVNVGTSGLPSNAAMETGGNLDNIYGAVSELFFHSSELSNINIDLDTIKQYIDQLESMTSGIYLNQTNGTQKVRNATDSVQGTFVVGAAGQTIILNTKGFSSFSIQITGTVNSNLVLDGTIDNTNWVQIGSSILSLTSVNVSNAVIFAATNGIWVSSTLGMNRIRLRNTGAISSGAATVTMVASTIPDKYVTISHAASGFSVYGISAGTQGLMKQEDVAAASADYGVFGLGVRSDTLTASNSLTSANGKYIQQSATDHGAKLVKDECTHKRTYRVTTGGFNVAASATDIFAITGVANAKISVTKIIVSATQTTASNINVTCLVRRSANSGGTSTSLAGVKLDGNGTASPASTLFYTANPTTGTLEGNLETIPLFVNATNALPVTYTFDFGAKGQPVILNSASQVVAINLGGGTVAGGSFWITAEYTLEY